ncbi:thiamine-phosphate pyrophosphorylase [Pullulanibacillus pueri]|uniref:Thiamine-phosphate synthase n=1 Tax=Pullulanibacillus pueri TaxID=1437324 RepID=A0A8J2ZW91_9BACL|nr:thiamine phosphate synthase [Pullulanibacillus pueri]MBM7682402.1 thiamine-phosphate pyrophosphorylase [Pullulanibacillus pueri]GGH81777.1 thiamine-phosphate synthase [Pullulanibacillus pueri]
MLDKHAIDYSVYLVTEKYDGRHEELFLKKIEQALKGGVTLVQLREKALETRALYTLAKRVKTLTTRYNVPFIINDRLDLALAIEADGLHLGQKDLPASVARRLLGEDKLLGVSAETVEQAKRAECDGADYLGVGSVFPTKTKDDATIISIDALRKIKAAVSLPIVAIGGITLQNAGLIIKEKVAGVAVVSAILGANQPEQAAAAFRKLYKTIEVN